jgi:opacity protein-like surface antigen
VNQLDERILSVDTSVHYQWTPAVGFKVGYRYSDFNSKRLAEPISRDTDFHTATMAVKVNLN